MIKKLLLLLLIVLAFESKAQVGVNTTDPKAQLDIRSTNQVTPSNTDGLLIPKINAFPVTNPTVDQQGMLVYLTTTVGANTPGFYYWNNPTTTWLPVKGTDGGTLDQAYDFGGAGNGRTITADAGAVTIAGTDGLVSTGTSGSGAIAPSGAGTRMVWNPRKAAFRVGTVSGTSWDDASIGNGSVAFGNSTALGNNAFAGSGASASGTASFAFGFGATATGQASFAFGQGASVLSGSQDAIAIGIGSQSSGIRAVSIGAANFASGSSSVAIGSSNTSSGSQAVALGNLNTAVGTNSMALGRNNTSSSFGETVLGIGATTYTPSTNGATQFRTTNATDRLFVIGNAIDADNNNTVDLAERSDAMVVLKNGKTGFGTSLPLSNVEIVGNNVTTGASTYGNLHVRTIDNFAADVGGSITIGGAFGAGVAPLIFYRNFASIEARKTNSDLFDQNAYLIFKTLGTGALIERMRITADGDVGIGTGTPGSKLHIVGNLRMVDGNQAAGKVLTSDVNGTATWQNASANAWGLIGNTGTNSATNFIGTTDPTMLRLKTDNIDRMKILANGNIEIGGAPVPSLFEAGTSKLLVGSESSTTDNLTVWAAHSTTAGRATLNLARQRGSFSSTLPVSNSDGLGELVFSGYSNALGSHLTAASVFADVDGTLAANNVPAKLGFSTAPETGGSPIERMTIRSNGNLGIGTTTPQERLHVAGKAFLTDGFSTDNAALLYRNDTDYMFLGPQSGSSAAGGALALFGSTNVSGGNAGGIDLNVPNGQVRLSHTNGSYNFSANSTSGYTATFELNDSGFEIGNNSASRALIFSPNSTERMRITPAGNVGIGTTIPAQKLHVSGPAGLTAVRIGNTSGTGSTSNVALDFFRNTAVNTDWRIYNIGANLTVGNSADDLATVNDLYQFQGARFMPMSDATISLGQGANRWNTLFASNGTINTSDAREKKNIQNLSYGLKEILRLRPVSFEWKKDDGSGTKLGLIAQELQQVLPETVRDWDWETNEQGIRTKVTSPVMGVYYSDIIPVLVKAVQELQEVIENQKTEIELLKKQLEQQQKSILDRLQKLEAKN